MSEIPLSLIIPAYQEELRIADTVKALSAYLQEHFSGAEIILVCDGCTDNTAKVAAEAFQSTNCQLKIIELETNKGKGNAIKTGIAEAKGDYLVFTDADLSFAPEIIGEQFLPKLKAGADVVIAQRNKKAAYPSIVRRMLAQCSRFFVGNILLPGIRDTQAGYKGFTQRAGQELFARIRTTRFLFDLEILLIARRKNYKIEKVYVAWQDKPGSTIRLVPDLLRCSRDLLIIYTGFLLAKYDK